MGGILHRPKTVHRAAALDCANPFGIKNWNPQIRIPVFGRSVGIRCILIPLGIRIIVLPPSSRRQATVHWTVAFDYSNPFH